MYLKKEGRIAKAYRLKQKGLTVKEIAAKMKLKVWVVRAYIWRALPALTNKKITEDRYC